MTMFGELKDGEHFVALDGPSPLYRKTGPGTAVAVNLVQIKDHIHDYKQVEGSAVRCDGMLPVALIKSQATASLKVVETKIAA